MAKRATPKKTGGQIARALIGMIIRAWANDRYGWTGEISDEKWTLPNGIGHVIVVNFLSYFFREVPTFLKGNKRLRQGQLAEAIDLLSKISSDSPIYAVSQGMTAHCQVRAGLWKDARESLRSMREAEPDDAALMAYADHIEAVMENDLGKYGEAIQRYNTTIKDRFNKRNLPLFYPKPQGDVQ